MKLCTILLRAAFLLCILSTSLFSQVLSLEQVIREVCENSDSVKLMRESSVKSEQMIREKWSAVYPTISGTIFAGKTYPVMGGSLLAPTKTSSVVYNSNLQITQTLYTFGKINSGIKIALQYDSSVLYANKSNIQQLQLSALDAFFRVLLAQKALYVSERSLGRKQELLEFLERNFKMGSGSKAQILATQADLKGQWTDIVMSRQNLLNARLILSMMLGRTLSDTLSLDSSVDLSRFLLDSIPNANTALNSALEERMDIRVIKLLEKANNEGAKIFDALYLPSIVGQASFGSAGSEVSNLFDRDYKKWTFGVGLQRTFFDGFANRAKADQYRSDSRKLQIAAGAIEKMIQIQVLAALSECAAADSNQIAMKEMFAAANESYELTKDNFKQGSGHYTELLLFEERLRQSEFGIMNARYRVVRSRAALSIAIGQEIIR